MPSVVHTIIWACVAIVAIIVFAKLVEAAL
jgi:hypothetical protein